MTWPPREEEESVHPACCTTKGMELVRSGRASIQRGSVTNLLLWISWRVCTYRLSLETGRELDNVQHARKGQGSGRTDGRGPFRRMGRTYTESWGEEGGICV